MMAQQPIGTRSATVRITDISGCGEEIQINKGSFSTWKASEYVR
jgi:hypothetical protein